ncbi:hypothetical protein D9M68_732630 [compost metagenome]
MHCLLVARVHRGPVDVLHEGIDVRAGGGAVVQVVGVLVHVQRQEGRAARQRMGVISSPLVDQRALARLEGEQHPARAAAKRLAHRCEFLVPSVDAAEAGRQCECHGGLHRLAVAAERREVQLVQQHRVAGDELFALEAVELEARRGGERCRGELSPDGVEALDRAAIVVLVMAVQKLRRQAAQRGGIEGQGLSSGVHGDSFSAAAEATR